MDIAAFGEILIDLTQVPGDGQVPLFAANPGGAPANVAVCAARLGGSASFTGKVGQDALGDYLRRVLAENGVDTAGLCSCPLPTTMAIVAVDGTGERTFQFVRGADWSLTEEDVPEEAIAGARFFHFGSVSLTGGTARAATLAALAAAKRHRILVSYDPNYREALWPDPSEAAVWMRKPLGQVDVLKVSLEELPLLAGTAELEEGARRLQEAGPALVLVSLGKDGAYYKMGALSGTVPSNPVSVADTNGAGDTFLGAVLFCLCRRGDAPLETLTGPELERMLRFANAAAAKTCSRSGAIPAMPTLAELAEEGICPPW